MLSTTLGTDTVLFDGSSGVSIAMFQEETLYTFNVTETLYTFKSVLRNTLFLYL